MKNHYYKRYLAVFVELTGEAFEVNMLAGKKAINTMFQVIHNHRYYQEPQVSFADWLESIVVCCPDERLRLWFKGELQRRYQHYVNLKIWGTDALDNFWTCTFPHITEYEVTHILLSWKHRSFEDYDVEHIEHVYDYHKESNISDCNYYGNPDDVKHYHD